MFSFFAFVFLSLSTIVAAAEYNEPCCLVFQNFDNAGTKSTLYYDYYKSNPSLQKNINPVKETGKICLQIKPQGANPDGGTVGIYPCKEFNSGIGKYPLTGKSLLSMMVLDLKGEHNFECKIIDAEGKNYTVWSGSKSKKVKWAKIYWEFREFIKQGLQPEKISRIEIYVYEKGIYFIDNIVLAEPAY
ncbi:MAG: hypothetical protein JW728_00760 [Candidatus Aureabacteria bacterium]|nr:hypothetical protein [Candidatus Auribacterota bacterium]